MSQPNFLLAINAGSSSIKLSLFTVSTTRNHPSRTPTEVLSAELSHLTSPPLLLTLEPVGFDSIDEQFCKKKELTSEEAGEGVAGEKALELLLGRVEGVEIPGEGRLERVGISHVLHRIVHGGHYTEPQMLTPKTVQTLTDLADLAPLHNAASLPLVQWCLENFPDSTKQIAFFDSSFHSTLPDASRNYMLAPEMTNNGAIRRYGFHGLSYASILSTVSSYLQKPENNTSILALHLGSGCSACAIQNGKSIATTMGLTPLEGLPGATRAGTIDPSAIFHMLSGSEEAGRISYKVLKEVGISKAEELLNKKSGWKALTGTSDFGELTQRAIDGDDACFLAFSILLDKIIQILGAYYVLLGGEVDALVFAGGIGEKSTTLRREVIKRVECLGFKICEERNDNVEVGERKKVGDVTIGDSKMNRVLVVRTQEAGRMGWECCAEERFWE